MGKQRFYDELACEWNWRSNAEMVLGFEDFNKDVGKWVDRVEGIHAEMVLVKKMLLEFCNERELCVANIWFKKNEERKIIFRSGRNRTEVDFVLV